MYTVKKLNFTGACHSGQKFEKFHGNIIVNSGKLHSQVQIMLPNGEKATGHIITPDKKQSCRAINGYALSDRGNGFNILAEIDSISGKGTLKFWKMQETINTGKRATAVITDGINFIPYGNII